jgi:hypothetical protein
MLIRSPSWIVFRCMFEMQLIQGVHVKADAAFELLMVLQALL